MGRACGFNSRSGMSSTPNRHATRIATGVRNTVAPNAIQPKYWYFVSSSRKPFMRPVSIS